MSDLGPEDSTSEADSEDAQHFVCMPFTVQVNTLIGTNFLLGIFPVDTVRVVKQRIGVQESLNPAHQHLLLGSRELGDHELVQDVRLGHGAQLTLIMTLRGGPTPVAQRQRDNLLATVQNRDRASVRPAQVVQLTEGTHPDQNNKAEFLEIVLVKCDGSVHVYYIPKPAADNSGVRRASDRPNPNSWAEAYYTESDEEEDSSSEEDEITPRAKLTQQVAVENCKTRSRMVALQQKMAIKRQKRRKLLMKETRASLATARRKVPSPRVKPYSMQPFHERAHQYPKTLGYMKATKRLNLLKAEMYLQAKRYKNVFGWSPYTATQLNDYVTAKLHVLIEDEGYVRPSAMFPTQTPLTPTILLKDPCTPSSSELGETESNRTRVQTARNDGPNPNRKNISAKTSKQVARCTTAVARESGVAGGTRQQRLINSPCTSYQAKAKAVFRKNTDRVPDARPTTCFSLPCNEVPRFDFGHDNYGYDHRTDMVETPRREKRTPCHQNPRKNSRTFGPSSAESEAEADLLKSLSDAFSRAGVTSARLKYKTVPSAGPESGSPSTREQEPAIDLMTEPEPSEPTVNPLNSEPHLRPSPPAIGSKTVTSKPKPAAPASPSTSKARKSKSKSSTAAKPSADANRCGECKKKLTIVGAYECRCGQFYCSKHRYAEAHSCTYDYKAEGRRLIEKANPVVTASKVKHI